MELELAEGITLHFELESYDKGEKATFSTPGEAPEFHFKSSIKLDDIEYTDDLETLRDSLTAIIEGTCLNELMTAEYVNNNQPEPDDHCFGSRKEREWYAD